MKQRQQERGAVSLFVVIFAMLLITIVTVSFLRFMVQGQQDSSDQDLSQSALDSAQAGVQDASRALLRYESCINAAQTDCGDPTTWSTCNNLVLDELYQSTGATSVKEIPLQQTNITQTDNSQSLNQAYTCVTASLATTDVEEGTAADTSRIVPLSAQNSTSVSYIEVQWFESQDLASNNNTDAVTLQPNIAPLPLFSQYNGTTKTGWNPNTPSVLRLQLFQFSPTGGFKLTDLDSGSNADTLFLYPTNNAPASTSFNLDTHTTPNGVPVGANCLASLSSGGYDCSEIIQLPTPVNDADNDRTAYLRVTPLYNATHYSVTLLSANNAASTVDFYNVQPTIDSTGRANDLFKRVSVRVDLFNQDLPFPTDAVNLTGSFCKNFAVTNNAANYTTINAGNTTCSP